jgi:hypothetical protein
MIKKSTLALIALIFSMNIAKGQGCLSGILDGPINVTAVFQTTNVPTGSPSYFSFNGIAGATYLFTYCQGGGSYSYDTYLTVANNVPVVQQFNDDWCGLGSEITWFCGAAGPYRLYTSACCACGFKGASATLAYKYTLPNCSGTPAASGSTATPMTLCAGQTASMGITTSYGNGGITYQWQSAPSGGGPWTNIGGATTPTWSGVIPSTLFYHCVITCTPSGGVAISSAVMITANPSPTVIIGGPSQMCAGGSVSLSAVGAASYTWNTGSNLQNQIFSPATTTTYSIIGLAGGCTGTAAITVTVNPNPTVTVAGINTVCAGAILTLTANGASTYTWSSGDLTQIVNVSPGSNITYTVFGSTPAGCTGFATHAVTVNAVPVCTVTGPNSMCIGQTVTINAVGANTYSWSNGMPTQSIAVSPTTTTTYSVYGISPLGCVGPPTTKVINVNPKPNISVVVCTPTMCLGEACTFTAVGADTYSWNTGALTTTIFVNPPVGNNNYTVVGTNTATGCMNTTTMTMLVSACTGVDNASYDTDVLSIYPNPSNGEFTVKFKDGVAKKIAIYDVNGKEVYFAAAETEKHNVNITKLANGIYYIKIFNENGSKMIKIVKEK